MADRHQRERLFARTDVREAEERLRKLVAQAAGTSMIGAGHLLRDHYRDASDPRHPVTRWS